MLPVEIVEADLNRRDHQQAVVELVDAYAADPMGNGKPLSAEVRRTLIPGLQKHPTTLIFLAYFVRSGFTTNEAWRTRYMILKGGTP